MNTDFHERVMSLIKEKGYNKSSFSKKIGVHPSVIQNITKGRKSGVKSKPSFEVIEKIFLAFDDLDYYYFITGIEKDMPLSTKNCNCEELEAKDKQIEQMQQQIDELKKDRSDLMRMLSRFTS